MEPIGEEEKKEESCKRRWGWMARAKETN